MPDFKADAPPDEGMSPFIMNPEGVARFFAVDKMAEGPFPEHYEPFETPLANNPLHPDNRWRCSNPAARVFKGDREAFGKAKDFPTSATTYRLTEHFHFWTKHARINAILQPEQFVEIGEELAKEKGIKARRPGQGALQARLDQGGGGGHQAHPAAQVDGKTVHTVGIPIHWGFKGVDQERLPRQHADAVRGRRQHPDAGVQGVPRQRREGLGGAPWHCNRSTSSAAPPPPRRRPSQRQTLEVAKLIDISKCIGCKACQVACMEWNDLRDDGRHQHRHLRQPARPDRELLDGDAVLPRWNPTGKLEWLIRKDGCMHCADPGCLKACPAPGAIVQYSNGIVDFHEENCIGCGYCITGCPFNIPRLSKKDSKVYKCTLCSDRVAVGLEPACIKTCPTGRARVRHQGGHDRPRRGAHRRPEGARLSRRPACTTRRAWAART